MYCKDMMEQCYVVNKSLHMDAAGSFIFIYVNWFYRFLGRGILSNSVDVTVCQGAWREWETIFIRKH